jgi:hypothetical protein
VVGVATDGDVFPSVLDAVAFIGTAPSPGSSANISITKRQVSNWPLANITVNVTLVPNQQ